jgi:hypothetical protein
LNYHWTHNAKRLPNSWIWWNLDQEEPDNGGDNSTAITEGCVAFQQNSDYKLADFDCSNSKNYICEIGDF